MRTQTLLSPVSQLVGHTLHHLLGPALHLPLLKLVPGADLDVLPLQGEEGDEDVHQTVLDHPAVLETSSLIEGSIRHEWLEVCEGDVLRLQQ